MSALEYQVRVSGSDESTTYDRGPDEQLFTATTAAAFARSCHGRAAGTRIEIERRPVKTARATSGPWQPFKSYTVGADGIVRRDRRCALAYVQDRGFDTTGWSVHGFGPGWETLGEASIAGSEPILVDGNTIWCNGTRGGCVLFDRGHADSGVVYEREEAEFPSLLAACRIARERGLISRTQFTSVRAQMRARIRRADKEYWRTRWPYGPFITRRRIQQQLAGGSS